MNLRAYQDDAVNAILARFDAGDQRTLCVLPTGGGKTIVAGHVARRMLERTGKRVMVLAHRDELIRQAADKFAAVTGIMPAVEKADERSQENGLHGPPRIVVSSIQTQTAGRGARRRMTRFCPADFGLVWVDEAHHATAGTWRMVVDYYASNPACKVLMVTATADRADGEMLGGVCQSVAYRYELPDIIRDGYLVPIVQRTAFIEGLDFSSCRTTAGDLNGADLEAAMLAERPFHGVAHATIEVACGLERNALAELRDRDDRADVLAGWLDGRRRKKTLVFTVGVKQAEKLAEVLNRWLPRSADWVAGVASMTQDRRRQVFRRFRNGSLQFLVNCQVATEGFDDPGTELVAVARPTKSRPLYTQMVGRATRPAEALAGLLGSMADADARRAAIESSVKPCCEVLDFAGNAGRHRLVSTADLLGCAYEPSVVDAVRGMDGVDVAEALELAREDIERKRREAEAKRRKREEEEEARRAADAARRAKLVGTGLYSLKQVDPFDGHAVRVARAERPAESVNGIPAHTYEWLRDKGKVPEADLRRMSRDVACKLASTILMRFKRHLCTYKQGRALERIGYTKDEIRPMTIDQASAAIDAAKANGWRRADAPAGVGE